LFEAVVAAVYVITKPPVGAVSEVPEQVRVTGPEKEVTAFNPAMAFANEE
jgi:hypothetical protein